jgi:hypothetical protein
MVEGRHAQGDLEQGRKVGIYEIIAPIGEGGPPLLARNGMRDLRRGLAVAQRGSTW